MDSIFELCAGPETLLEGSRSAGQILDLGLHLLRHIAHERARRAHRHTLDRAGGREPHMPQGANASAF